MICCCTIIPPNLFLCGDQGFIGLKPQKFAFINFVFVFLDDREPNLLLASSLRFWSTLLSFLTNFIHPIWLDWFNFPREEIYL
ncbi:hypothetical protein FGO68_gene1645 [Halteria grandinella]|uniref:Uncharacterized protein n=1 Tax=Halteria grandinella TaxID=5974 RepID=A0A8J8T6L0_HALGN|nr:hypothetical protein FGO68_gene1645 [Halteria grandinella]